MLQQLLEKLGIHDIDKLTAEERKTYQTWATILAAPDVTFDDVKKLLAKEEERATAELKNFENTKDKQIFYQALARLASTLKLFIETPANEREALKAHLKQVFHIDA